MQKTSTWRHREGLFILIELVLVIEMDGDIHNLQKEEDERWEKVLNEMGLRVVHFRNDEVEMDLSVVVGKIREIMI